MEKTRPAVAGVSFLLVILVLHEGCGVKPTPPDGFGNLNGVNGNSSTNGNGGSNQNSSTNQNGSSNQNGSTNQNQSTNSNADNDNNQPPPIGSARSWRFEPFFDREIRDGREIVTRQTLWPESETLKQYEELAAGDNGLLVRHGVFMQWHENGMLQQRADYANGLLDGRLSFWYSDGALRQTSEWRRGELDGRMESFDERGNLVRSAKYEHGRLKEVKFEETGSAEKNASSTAAPTPQKSGHSP